ncbi:MAG: DNA glycosylase [Candidatus Dormibacteraeota bacterium]|nr:DNA glycosylase [Candidatus Dormibacteraeota bacterium]
MPEGDTIWRTAAGLRSALEGRQVVSARPPSLARLQGTTLEAVEPVGKHLLLRFSGGWTLHTHMRMNGSWHLYAAGERWRKPEFRARAVLDFGDRTAVCFSAPVVELVRDPRRAVAHLGPDLVADGVRLEEVVGRARALGPTPLGELLLDQRVCSGIGNVYKCEALWERRLDPWRSSAEVSDQELAELYATARDALRSNVQEPFRRRFTGGRPAAVHGRRGRPCPRCGVRVASRRQGEQARWTYWCPGCQG